MATLVLDPKDLMPLVEQIAQAVIAKLDIPAIVKTTAIEAERQHKVNVKSMYTCQETARILGIKVTALKERRLAGSIKGKKVSGCRGFMYAREEIERVLGKSLG